MKTTFSKNTTLLISCLTLFMIIFVIKPGNGQEPAKKHPTNKAYIRIMSEDDGKQTVIDTTVAFSDTISVDSIRTLIDKWVVIGKGGKSLNGKSNSSSNSFEYHFEIPDLPDVSDVEAEIEGWSNLENLAEHKDLQEYYELQNNLREDMGSLKLDLWRCQPHCRVNGYNIDEDKNLKDILDNVPMDRIKKYSIKSTRHGKKIVIELEDGPGKAYRSKVIVVDTPKNHKRHRTNFRYSIPYHDKKLKEAEEQEVQSGTSAPEKKKDTPDPGAPKI